MESCAERLGIDDQVEFMGYLPHRSLPEVYSRSWLAFDPMYMGEIDPYWGGTLKEALACGTPVIAFNDRCPGGRPFGYLIPSEPHSAARSLATHLADPAELFSKGKHGQSYVERHCEWRIVIKRLQCLYGEVAA
jgi:glycosyltransferase involved in cell wall biosynthesis